MRIHHIALVCRSEENADRFYRDLLGFERTRSYTVPAGLSSGLFGFDRGYVAITYQRSGMAFEVFVIEGGAVCRPHVHHVGLEVEDQEGFLGRCREMQVQIREVPKGGRIITMIRDFDGNLFEIKEKG